MHNEQQALLSLSLKHSIWPWRANHKVEEAVAKGRINQGRVAAPSSIPEHQSQLWALLPLQVHVHHFEDMVIKGPDKWWGCLGQTGVAEWTVDGILIPAPDNTLPILNRVPDMDKHEWKTWPGTRGRQGEGWPRDEQKEPQSHPTLKQEGQLGLGSPNLSSHCVFSRHWTDPGTNCTVIYLILSWNKCILKVNTVSLP